MPIYRPSSKAHKWANYTHLILPLHIIIALSSLGFTAYTFFSPTKTKLRVSYLLIALVFITGFYLIWSRPAHMVQTCTEGLVYLGVIFAGIWAAKRKFIHQQNAKHSLV